MRRAIATVHGRRRASSQNLVSSGWVCFVWWRRHSPVVRLDPHRPVALRPSSCVPRAPPTAASTCIRNVSEPRPRLRPPLSAPAACGGAPVASVDIDLLSLRRRAPAGRLRPLAEPHRRMCVTLVRARTTDDATPNVKSRCPPVTFSFLLLLWLYFIFLSINSDIFCFFIILHMFLDCVLGFFLFYFTYCVLCAW